MNSLLRNIMSGDANVNRPLPSLILLGIVDFCCILIGLEQINDHKIIGGIVWVAVGVGSGLVGYYWQHISRMVGDWLVASGRRLQNKLEIPIQHPPTGDPKEPSLSRHFVFVNVISLRVDEQTVPRGRTLKIRYEIDSSESIADDIWLGASLWDKSGKFFWNTRQDKPISLLKGIHEYDRDLTIAANVPLGNHSLRANVWHGVIGDSAKSMVIAKGSPVEIVVVA